MSILISEIFLNAETMLHSENENNAQNYQPETVEIRHYAYIIGNL